VMFISIHGNTSSNTSASNGEIYYYRDPASRRSDSSESESLAKAMAANYSISASGRSVAIGQDFAVLRCQYNDTPAVLAEVGYLSNPRDMGVFRSAITDRSVADNLAMKLTAGIKAYLDQRYPPQPSVQVAINDRNPF